MLIDPNNEKLQELSIIVTDRIRSIDKKWWYSLIGGFVLCFPLFFLTRPMFVSLKVYSHKFPAYLYEDESKVPLEVTEKKIFNLGNNYYSGYIKIKNSTNHNWGVVAQSYTAVFATTGGTEIARVSNSTFILPQSEKIVVFARFYGDKEPTEINVTLGPTTFTHKPQGKSDPQLAIERKESSVVDSKLVVSGSVKNKTPFTIKKIGLPTLLYDLNNNIVGVNYTNIDDVNYGETRSFQLSWPNNPKNVARIEILPEVNIFDQNIYTLPPGSSQFDTTTP